MSDAPDPVQSRRQLLKAGVGLAASCLAPVALAAPAAAAKIAPAMVQYQGQPKDGKQCSQCVQFVAPNACKVVDGVISPTGWCAAFAPKS